MKKTILTIALCVAAALGAAAATKPGVEVLRDNDFKQLAGKRVGLITNPTGVDNNLKSTVDILHEAKGVELVALFGPEHGVRGNVHAGDEFGNTTDPATGVKVFSIYGKTKKPTKEMLSGIDALVYDIQDIGCRSFTFVSTLGLALDACAENDIEFVVLDRPNPLGGNRVEGCLVEDGFYSFVSQFKIPYLYGMTPGEMARYLNGERVARGEKAAKLTVVPLKGWKRSMTFDKTGMPWVLPSPHIPQPATAFYYPATGILGELYYVSIGVGYTLPFQLICADWIDADKFAARMNALNLPGTKFRPMREAVLRNRQGREPAGRAVLCRRRARLEPHAHPILCDAGVGETLSRKTHIRHRHRQEPIRHVRQGVWHRQNPHTLLQELSGQRYD